MKLSKRERILIAIAFLVVLGIGVDALMRHPALSPLFRGDPKARLAQQEALSRRLSTEADNLRKDVKRLEARMKSLAVQQPPGKLLPATMKTAQATARKAGVILTEIRPLKAEEESGWARLPIELRLQEAFPKIVAFLYQLESPDLKLAVRKVRLASSDSKSDRVDAQIQIEVYAASEGGKQVAEPTAAHSDIDRPAGPDRGSRPEATDSVKLTGPTL